MKVSGFTIIKNGIKYFYPFIEAITSILPLCDEFIVNVGDSDDGTLKAVSALQSRKVRILESKWDMSLHEGGKLLSIETNKALKLCSGDWCFYIQADEVLHEKYIPAVRTSMEKYLDNRQIEGLRFRYKHFHGSYNYYQDNFRKWYPYETRIIRNNENIISWGDAMNFKHSDGSSLRVVPINAEIYHYGWVRPPDTMTLKRINLHKLYHHESRVEELAAQSTRFDDLGNLKKFTDTHPAVMYERIKEADWGFDAKLDEQMPDWIRKIFLFLQPVTKRIKKMK